MDLKIGQRFKDIKKLGFGVPLISIFLLLSTYYPLTLLDYSSPVLTLLSIGLFLLFFLCGIGLLLSFKIAREATVLASAFNIFILAIFLVKYGIRVSMIIEIIISIVIIWYLNKPEVIEEFY